MQFELTEERRLDKTQDEAKRYHASITLDRSTGSRDNCPSTHDGWQKDRRAYFIQYHVSRNLREYVPGKEDTDDRIILSSDEANILFKRP